MTRASRPMQAGNDSNLKSMKMFNMLFSILIFGAVSSCKGKGRQGVNPTYDTETFYIRGENDTSFELIFTDDDRTRGLLKDSTIYESANMVTISMKKNLPALKVETKKEFSDAFINLEKLFQHTIDFSKSRYLHMNILVPEGSWIHALKLNFKDSGHNYGGVGEYANNFYGQYDQWMDIVVDMQNLIPKYESWYGSGNPLENVSLLGLNPYNAYQGRSSVIYIHSLKLTDIRPNLKATDALVHRVDAQPNIPFRIDFDDGEKLQRYMAYRSFESSFQALEKVVADNPTTAIRLKGNEENKYIAFLPKLQEMTGSPVHFTKVSRIRFSYYLTKENDDFKSSSLYLATENWENILYDEDIFSDFIKGLWQLVSIDTNSLQLNQIRGEQPVLPTVYKLRFGLE